MYPRIADLQAVFTAVGAGRDVFDLIEMTAFHGKSPVLVRTN
jgi:hypothetical protein